jgi:hypothetical protein
LAKGEQFWFRQWAFSDAKTRIYWKNYFYVPRKAFYSTTKTGAMARILAHFPFKKLKFPSMPQLNG